MYRSLAAELLGTTVLVWLATSTCAQFPHNGSTLQTALTVGSAVIVLIYGLGPVSGCHINPAVTQAFLLTGRISWVKALLYIVAQLLGAVAGAAIYMVTTPPHLRGVGLCSTRLDSAQGVSWAQALALEAFMTFVLILVILAVTDNKLSHPGGPLMVGLAVVADFLMGLEYSGCSLNPARSFGPAVLSGYFKDHGIYWVGPLLGSRCAALVWILVLKPLENENENRYATSIFSNLFTIVALLLIFSFNML